MRRVNGVIALWAVLCISLPESTRAEKIDLAGTIGRTINDFALADYRGKEYALAEFADKEVIVVAFLGNECPLCRQYGPRLEQLSKELADRGVAFLGINSNQQDTPTEVAAFVRACEITFPLLKDPGNVVADQFAAVRVPEVFVLDKQRKVRYRGRVDDQFGLTTGSGYARPKIRSHDLAVAIEEVLAGKKVCQSVTEASGCLIGRAAKITPHGDITYNNQIVRLLQKRCVECHRAGEVAPFALVDYQEVVGWAPMMCEVIDQGRMPPWFADPAHGSFANDVRLSAEEKTLFRTWVDNGCPEGDPHDLPPPPSFATGWQMGEPDQVIYIRDEPYTVPADGVVAYQYFVVDPHFTEDKWVQAAEARPGNRAVVHHMIAFVQAPPSARRPATIFAAAAAWSATRRATAANLPAGRGRLRPRRVEVHLSDALHADRHEAGGSQLHWPEVRRPNDGQASRAGWCGGEPALYDSARRRESAGQSALHVRPRLAAGHAIPAHAPAR